MSDKKVILLGFMPQALDEAQVQAVRDAAPGYEVVVSSERGEIERLLERIEIAAGGFPREWLPRATSLRWMQQWGAGADWLLRRGEEGPPPFTLTNVSGVHAVPISEHILALCLAFVRGLDHAGRIQQRGVWQRPPEGRLGELAGATMLVVGVGAIGERTALLARCLEMRVLGVRRSGEPSPYVDQMYRSEQLLEVLPEADIVANTLPLTRETRGLFGEAEFRAMKPSAFIVNIGRGGTIQEAVMVRALREGWIAGAGLDVFEEEPLPAESPLWGMPNVIVTCHYAGRTPRYNERSMEIFLDNLHRYVEGRPLRNVVDPERGY